MQILPAGPEHLDELYRLYAHALVFDRFSLDLLREKLEDSVTWAAFDRGRIVGAMQSVRRGEKAWLGLFAVETPRRGIASALWPAILASWHGAKEAEVLAIPGNYFAPGLDPRYTAALAFLEKAGFTRFKDCVNMMADLREPLDTREIEGVELRRATKADGPLLDAFFAAHFGADWRLEAGRADGLHLALRDGRIVGFAAHSGQNREWGWFGPMGTAPEAEGRGIGRELLRRCLNDLRDAGHGTAVIPWAGPIGFYARHCACRVDRVFWRYRLTLGGTSS